MYIYMYTIHLYAYLAAIYLGWVSELLHVLEFQHCFGLIGSAPKDQNYAKLTVAYMRVDVYGSCLIYSL